MLVNWCGTTPRPLKVFQRHTEPRQKIVKIKKQASEAAQTRDKKKRGATRGKELWRLASANDQRKAQKPRGACHVEINGAMIVHAPGRGER